MGERVGRLAVELDRLRRRPVERYGQLGVARQRPADLGRERARLVVDDVVGSLHVGLRLVVLDHDRIGDDEARDGVVLAVEEDGEAGLRGEIGVLLLRHGILRGCAAQQLSRDCRLLVCALHDGVVLLVHELNAAGRTCDGVAVGYNARVVQRHSGRAFERDLLRGRAEADCGADESDHGVPTHCGIQTGAFYFLRVDTRQRVVQISHGYSPSIARH